MKLIFIYPAQWTNKIFITCLILTPGSFICNHAALISFKRGASGDSQFCSVHNNVHRTSLVPNCIVMGSIWTWFRYGWIKHWIWLLIWFKEDEATSHYVSSSSSVIQEMFPGHMIFRGEDILLLVLSAKNDAKSVWQR